ncbi:MULTISPECIES: helix-turn-helix domain-containing protein [unclassified Sulfitobacter]|uniref:helix-turn-helix domain-containing protein n=1 Tax=unclassified Sulfitobacter TaxID=196795 RepID=UPI0007C2CCA9|nr:MULTISPECIES: helix-turn-helix domain-containing protein [unclassified Sulfitobacter]KZX94486.1 hypothetical protein A3720_04520 [Sulfitobacter sp. HI0021]KZY02144.1 hypothetical protein A3722_06380 [Sulfitobacter sp. HI0027]KZY99470.1 hypothetical protein A3747_00745 [Sulfitobacter sp. HI0076]
MGRDRKNERRAEHFTAMTRNMMETPAWRALSPCAQALYPWLRLEWRGAKANNNGKLRLSVRQAAERMGVNVKTAARAFHDLQAKGFVVVVEPARLGLGGEAKSPAFELTEISLPHSDRSAGRRLYVDWKPGADFNVQKGAVHNPRGGNPRKTAQLMKLVGADL